MNKVKNFKGFMRSKAINENDGLTAGYSYGANPEEEEEGAGMEGGYDEELDGEEMEGEEMEGEEEEEVTIEDLKAIVDDLEERLSALEPEEEESGDQAGSGFNVKKAGGDKEK